MLALLAALVSDVFVVDISPGPGVDFTNLQVAIDSVPDHSILLLQSGAYVSPRLDRPLSVIADNGATVVLQNVSNPLRMTSPSSGEFALLDGCRVAPIVGDGMTIELDGFQPGLLWIEEVAIDGSGSIVPRGVIYSGAVGITAVLSELDLHAFPAGAGEWAGGEALDLFGLDTLIVHDSYLEGAGGGPEWGIQEHGAKLNVGTFLATGSTFIGGDAPPAWFDTQTGQCQPEGYPGAGIVYGGTTGLLAAVNAVGGGPAASLGGCPTSGTSGVPTVGPLTELIASQIPRQLDVTRVVRSGQVGVVTLSGAPNESFVVAYSTTPAAAVIPEWSGALNLGASLKVLAAGQLDAAGSATVPFQANLTAGQGRVAFAQAAFFGSPDGLVIGSARAVLLLGPGF